MLILVIWMDISFFPAGKPQGTVAKVGGGAGSISRATKAARTLLGAGKRRGAFPERQSRSAHYRERGKRRGAFPERGNRAAHYLERRSAGAHFPSDKTARHTTWSGEAQGRSFPDGEPSGTVAAEKRKALYGNRGAGPQKGVPAGTCP